MKAKADSFMQMVVSMKELGKIAKLMETVFICMLMVQLTMDSGKMTFNMVTEKKFGQMVEHMKGNIGKETNMGKVFSNGKMDPLILGTSLKIRSQGQVSILGKMDASMKDYG